MKSVLIIGAGIGSLSAACYLAKAGCKVTILEKNSWPGGRIQTLKKDGFTFDMGPSWYWMPDVFEQFFATFGHTPHDYYTLTRLDPSYRIFFTDEYIDLPPGQEAMCVLFEKYEQGAGQKLKNLLQKTEKVYQIAQKQFIHRSSAPLEMVSGKTLINGVELLAQYNGFQSVHQFLTRFFRNEKLIKMLEFPIFFLGGSAHDIPAVYSIMNHVDIDQGTWYPHGGFGAVARGFERLACELGVDIHYGEEVDHIEADDKNITSVHSQNRRYHPSVVLSGADYPFTESLLPPSSRSYSPHYWDTRKLAPSALMIFLGISHSIPGLLHHSLFFHNDWVGHHQSLFKHPVWPTHPLYYVSTPTKTDKTLAPSGQEAITILIPLASGLPDSLQSREDLAQWVLHDLEKKINQPIQPHIITRTLYSLNDFATDYHAFKGNAYGLAQTLDQTAIFRPNNRSKKLNNLFYTGQFTVPGIGVPMVVISGEIAARDIISHI
ncbi:phytoene desaturase [Candidatus Roizmanbacteria bacterium]|nr:phytoene desaturase [Candidatus Roizmanbacteria bacterium]